MYVAGDARGQQKTCVWLESSVKGHSHDVKTFTVLLVSMA